MMTTLDTASRVLRCFHSDQRALSVTEVAVLLDIPMSRASRTLKSMQQTGLLERDDHTLAYRPAALLYAAGRIYRDTHSLFDQADAVVGRVARLTGHTGYLSRREGRMVVGLSDHPGTHVLRVTSPVGLPLAAFASATGRALLSLLPDDAVGALYDVPLIPPSPSAPQSLDELFERLARIRIDGYAESSDEANRGVGAIATTVGTTASQALALCIAFPAAVVQKDEKRLIIESLLDGAREIDAAVDIVHRPTARRRAGRHR